MDKEIVEKLKYVVDKLLGSIAENIKDKKKMFEDALKEPCTIHIDNDGKGTGLKIEGTRLGLLVSFAGAEKSLLKQLECSESEFDFIKHIVDPEVVDDE